jgi:hypothetical protein
MIEVRLEWARPDVAARWNRTEVFAAVPRVGDEIISPDDEYLGRVMVVYWTLGEAMPLVRVAPDPAMPMVQP